MKQALQFNPLFRNYIKLGTYDIVETLKVQECNLWKSQDQGNSYHIS